MPLTHNAVASHMVSSQVQHQVEQFLYMEAALLDAWQLRDWLKLLAPHFHYWAPLRHNERTSKRPVPVEPGGDLALFDDDLEAMNVRVRRYETGMAWAEEPRSRTRRLITNVQVANVDEIGDASGDYDSDPIAVASNFCIHRSRLDRETDLYIGGRRDVLVPTPDGSGFLIVQRHIYLDQAVLLSKNLSIIL